MADNPVDNSVTGTDNPVAVLLGLAAKGIREKAQAATRGPWRPETRASEDEPDAGAEHVAASDAANVARTGTDCRGAEADAAHIASWHPAMALAVAEWLETTAGRAEYLIDKGACEMCGDQVPVDGRPAPELCGCWDGALTVARTWLGETGEGQ